MGIGYLVDQPDHHQVEIQSKPIKLLSLSCLQGRTLQTGSTRERGSASLTLPAISPLFQPLSPRSTKFYWDCNFCISYTSLSLGHFALPIFTKSQKMKELVSFDSVSLGTVYISDSLYTLLQETNLGIVCVCHCLCASNSDHDGGCGNPILNCQGNLIQT